MASRAWKTAVVLLAAASLLSLAAGAQIPESAGLGAATAAQSTTSQSTAAANTSDPAAAEQNTAPMPAGVENSTSAITGQARPVGVGMNSIAPATMQISSGDLLEISVFDTPELSGRLRVNNHGDVLLPLAGYVHVQGFTAPEAAQAIADKLVNSQLMVHPQVSVYITEFATLNVTMAGEIRSPGVYPLLGPRTLLDMVTMAGGLGASASKVVSIIHRNDPTKVVTVRMNVSVQTPESFAAESYPIQPGDTIFVARSGLIYVVGDLKTPGSYQVEHNERLTLLDAVALAGGPTATSKLSDARLIRKGDHGREELQVDLKKILYGAGPDMLLQDGDILFVPVSQRKIYTLQAIQAVIGAATQYSLYKISNQN